ncbi:GumC family protein [Aquimarina mytili]|uniref:non-specific protein-tyrosine kinase n=1 Tax=Aquimarina mytili TaxID=874423 RepID=A0A936ZXX8_9FLAO|nr:polysaccharide biosynthesis tyrosine autokinase [Aquimarina mytili]MBL0683161.1 polysaccharide biosynthesis tyrosine autokinase [Aquimarina mytili]
MITNNNNTPVVNNEFKATSGFGFNLRDQIIKYLKKWYWFALSVTIFVALAYLKVRYTIPQYNISSTIMISQDDNISESELAAFKDLGLVNNTQSTISNEVQIIKSRTLITNVVNNLKLNVRYFSEGRILEIENYPKSLVEINFLSHDSIVHTKSRVFHVRIDSNTSFSFLDEKGKLLSGHAFGNTVNDKSIGDIVITPSIDDIESSIGKIIKIKITPVNLVTEAYRNKLLILPLKNSSTVKLSLNDPVKEKAKDIINNLVEEYNKATIENKKQISARTADFINERLNLISGDLSEVDDEAAGYLSRYGLTSDISAQTQRVADIDTRNVQQIAQLNTQLNLIESMRRFVLSQDGRFDLVPANLGFDDATISTTVSRYNGLILQRKRLLKTSSVQNPVVVNIDQQIDGLRQVLIGSLNSLKSSINIQLNSLRTQDKYFSGQLYSAPIREKEVRVIEREQTIKEQLYLYLLQKREEAQITSHVTLSNARVIDKASTLGSYPISPNRKVIYAGALFLGLLLPFMVIYLSDLFNVKVSSREDLEKVLSMPIIGSIPKVKSKKRIVISQNDRSSIAEAFRILRTNLGFLMAGTNKSMGKVIFVTSTISGEGKTLISSNLAKILAISGNKVVYLGTDLRDPKFHKFLDLPNGKDTKGLTNYIMNDALTPEDVIYSDRDKDLFDIIPSGAIPPNPAELLMQPRVEKMFKYLESKYDYIVVDTAPVSLVADTLLISHFSDLSIYIVRENYTDKRVLQMPENFYRDKRLPNVAVLLNAAGNQAGYNYGYGYGKKN